MKFVLRMLMICLYSGFVIGGMFLLSLQFNFFTVTDSAEQVTAVTAVDTQVIESKYDPSGALSELREHVQSNSNYMVQCHAEVHVIGNRAYSELKDEAYQFVDPMCGGGYLHGVIEQAFLYNGLNYMSDVVHKQCSGVIEESCLHGIGHGVHQVVGDVKDSVEICSQVASTNTDCYDGVFMDVFDMEGSASKQQLTPEDGILLCEETTIVSGNSCYFYLPRILSSSSPSSITDLCSSAEIKDGWAACAQGSGVFFMKYTSGFNKEIALSYCNLYDDKNLNTLCSNGVNDYEQYGDVENIHWR